jgi:hypothetical protein
MLGRSLTALRGPLELYWQRVRPRRGTIDEALTLLAGNYDADLQGYTEMVGSGERLVVPEPAYHQAGAGAERSVLHARPANITTCEQAGDQTSVDARSG